MTLFLDPCNKLNVQTHCSNFRVTFTHFLFSFFTNISNVTQSSYLILNELSKRTGTFSFSRKQRNSDYEGLNHIVERLIKTVDKMWTMQNVVFIGDLDVFRSTGKFFTDRRYTPEALKIIYGVMSRFIETVARYVFIR